MAATILFIAFLHRAIAAGEDAGAATGAPIVLLRGPRRGVLVAGHSCTAAMRSRKRQCALLQLPLLDGCGHE
eukprot:958181-Prymnesium_polylepis.1